MAEKNLEKIAEISLLYDFYGALLTERQRDVMSLYHEENYSIIEIADELGITKQGVHEALKKAEKLLRGYEEKLGLVEKLLDTQDTMSKIDKKIDALKKKNISDDVNKSLDEIKAIINKLEE